MTTTATTTPSRRARSTARPDETTAAVQTTEAVNDVRLVGRLSSVPTLVELPSGDALVTFRISVASAPGPGRQGGRGTSQRVDSLPCTAWSAALRRRVLGWRPGDTVEVSGALRCRFYQAGGATRSRVEVEAASGRIIRRAAAS